MELTERMDRTNFLSLTNTWILCVIFLVFASVYGFSFERGSLNSFTGVDMQIAEARDTQRDSAILVQNVAVYLLSVACILPFVKPVWALARRNAMLFSVVGWAILSVAWSEQPSTSAVNALRFALNVMLVIFLFERYSGNDIQKLMILVGCVAAAGNIIMVIAFPQYGLQVRGLAAFGAWEGIFGQKNLCGLEMLVLLLPAFFVKLTGIYAKGLRFGYIAIVMTQSVGAWVVTALCLSFVALLKLTSRMPGKDTAVIVAAVVALVLAAGVTALANFDAIMYGLGKDPTMTGRTVLWKGLAHIAMNRPILGYGYSAFWRGLDGPSRALALELNWHGLGGAESGVMEVWLELGIVGVLLYAAIFLRAVRDAFYCFGHGASPAALWYISILFYVVATNIEGGSLLMPSNLMCILPFVAFVGLRREVQLLRERQTA
jgi:O-antigen ligase